MGQSATKEKNITLRKLGTKDYDRMIECWIMSSLTIKIKGRDSRESIVRQMKLSTTLFIGAFDKEKGNRVIGLGIGTYDGRRGWVNRLAVLPEYRRRGVAAMITEKLEAFLRGKGATVISALIDRSNNTSKQFFEARGYSMHEDILYYAKRESPDA